MLVRQQSQEFAGQIKNTGFFAAITASGSGGSSIASASGLLSAGTQIKELGNLNISKGTFALRESTSTNNPDFYQTVLSYIKRWQFPVVEDASPVEVIYPFVFEGA